MGKLQGRVALISGGTTGIGLATARLFAREGATVTVTGTNPQTISAARESLRGVATVLASDSGSSEDIVELAERFAKTGIDILFLNAGTAKFGPIAGLDVAALDESFRVNVRGPWLMLKHFAPLLHGGGSVVFTGSVNGELGAPGSSAYAATKAAVRALVRVAASEFAEAGVRVNSVSPGPIDTPLYEKLGMPPDAVKIFAKTLIDRIPLKRFGKPEEVAAAVLFLASDDSSFMTGEEMVLDGGMTRV